MTQVQYFCPQCQGMELTLQDARVISVEELGAVCKLCGWSGTRADLLAGITPSSTSFWTSERVANALLAVVAKHAAGPVLHTLELIGLVPPIKGGEQEQASAQSIREQIMREVLGAVVTSAFETAARLSPEHFARFDPPMAGQTEHAFSFSQTRNHDDS